MYQYTTDILWTSLCYLVVTVGELRVAEEDVVRGEEGWRDGLGHVQPEAFERVHLKGDDTDGETQNRRPHCIAQLTRNDQNLVQEAKTPKTYAAHLLGLPWFYRPARSCGDVRDRTQTPRARHRATERQV